AVHVFQESLLIGLSVLAYRFVVPSRIANDLVIHIRDVHDMLQLEAAHPEQTPEDIHCDEGPEIADMAVVVDGWSAGIHANGIVHRGRKLLDFAGKRVVETQGHKRSKLLILGGSGGGVNENNRVVANWVIL